MVSIPMILTTDAIGDPHATVRYIKAKDQAVGTSFGEHVMAGYKFLMRYYASGDHIYFFGFSRGAYTARFLAQML